MGIVSFYFEFDHPAPLPDSIVSKVEAVSGLSIDVVSTERDIYREYRIELAFSEIPNRTIEIYAYQTGAIEEYLRKEQAENGFDPNWPVPIEGANEPKGKQRVYIFDYIGLEPTLMYAVSKALKELGGEPSSIALSDIPIRFLTTREELRKRHRANDRVLYIFWLKLVVMSPVLIPFWIIKIIILMVTMPWEIRKAHEKIKKKYPDI